MSNNFAAMPTLPHVAGAVPFRPMRKLLLTTALTVAAVPLTSASAAVLVSGDFTADNDSAPLSSQVTPGFGVTAAGANLAADGGFLHDSSNGFDLSAVVNTNLNTDQRQGLSFDFTTDEALTVTDADLLFRATSNDAPFHPDDQFEENNGPREWDDVTVTIFDASSMEVGSLTLDLSNQPERDFQMAGSLDVDLAGTSFNLLANQTYTAEFSALATNNRGVFFGVDTFAINGTVVPEPASAGALGLGLLALTARRRLL